MTGSPGPGNSTLYLCIGMIVKSNFVFVNLLRLFVTGSHGPGEVNFLFVYWVDC